MADEFLVPVSGDRPSEVHRQSFILADGRKCAGELIAGKNKESGSDTFSAKSVYESVSSTKQFGVEMWLVIRLLGIVVGIATLLRIATTSGLLTYDPLFLLWMDRLRDFVELGFFTDLLEPLLHRIVDSLRAAGWQLPTLGADWRNVFVISALYFGALARNKVTSHAARSAAVIAGFLSALLGGVLAGLVSHSAVVLGFLFGANLFWAAEHIIDSLRQPKLIPHYGIDGEFLGMVRPVMNWEVPTASLALSAAIAVGALFPSADWLIFASWLAIALWAAALLIFGGLSLRSLGYAYMASMVAAALFIPEVTSSTLFVLVLGYVSLISLDFLVRSITGMRGAVTFWGNVIKHDLNTGADILGVLFGSLFLASIFSNPPIW